MKDLIKNRKVLAGYFVLLFIHLFLYFRANRILEARTKHFWPFTSEYGGYGNEKDLYDFSELFVYAVLPILLAFLYTVFVKKDR